MLHRVKFTRPSGRYFPPDVAAFPLQTCERLVDGGVAEFVDPPPNGEKPEVVEEVEVVEGAEVEEGAEAAEPAAEPRVDKFATRHEELPPKRRAPAPDEIEDGDVVVFDVHTKTVAEVRDLVATIESLGELRALRDSEVAHPDNPGGRKGVLSALDKRIKAVS